MDTSGNIEALFESSNLTVDQLMMWAGQQLYEGQHVHNLGKYFLLPMAIDEEAFRAAFNVLLKSSDAFRMVVEVQDEIPNYRVLEEVDFDLPVLDFSHHSQAEEELRRWGQEQSLKRFESGRLLFDAALVRLSDESYALYMNQHHIVSDGYSNIQLVIKTLAELYRLALEGKLPPQIQLPSFTEAIGRAREFRKSDEGRKVDAFWKERLSEEIEPVFEYLSKNNQDIRAKRVETSLGESRTKKLVTVAKALSGDGKGVNARIVAMLAPVMLAQVCRLTGKRRLRIGIPLHGRNGEAAKRTIGLFFHTLPIEVEISDTETFASLRDKVLAELQLIKANSPYASPEVGKSYDLLLNYHVASLPQFEETSVHWGLLHSGYSQKGLSVHVHDAERTGNFTLWLDARVSAFQPEQIEVIDQQFISLLDGSLEDPDRCIHKVGMLSKNERELLFYRWNDTAASRSTEECVHHGFESQVERTPDSVAVSCGDRVLSYMDLNRRANQLAHYLQKQGVGPESLVGICVERSTEMLVGLLGILKVGGGYVPLDQSYPKERLAYIVEDSGIQFLVCQTKLLDRIPETNAECIDIQDDWHAISQMPDSNTICQATGENAAYVMYTSGSTGKPKGVVVLHRGVCNYLRWRGEYFPLTSADRVLQKTSFSFVDSIWELFEALGVGAQVVMADPEKHYDTHYLVSFIRDQKITAADFIPSLLEVFLEEPGVEKCVSLRRVTTGSEVVTVRLQQQFFERLNADLYNLYGPTEASIASTCWKCDRKETRRDVPIGRPVANTKIYLLDTFLQPVPIGSLGEVHIGGLGLARGYLNRPELTEEKFIPDPFSNEAGARLYKTGDLARYLSDGNLDFKGRIDHQVKIRGYRIELGEIESTLLDHEGVGNVAVIAREDEPGNKNLVAYLVESDGQSTDEGKLRSYLRERLPDYMVPVAFVFLEELPRTPNGKLDRESLPVPELERHDSADAFVGPRSELEILIAEVWSEQLGIESISVHDSFFDLGGDSLKAMRIVLRLKGNQVSGISLRAMFDAPTIAELAQVCSVLNY